MLTGLRIFDAPVGNEEGFNVRGEEGLEFGENLGFGGGEVVGFVGVGFDVEKATIRALCLIELRGSVELV